jgi:hypothetical protein
MQNGGGSVDRKTRIKVQIVYKKFMRKKLKIDNGNGLLFKGWYTTAEALAYVKLYPHCRVCYPDGEIAKVDADAERTVKS